MVIPEIKTESSREQITIDQRKATIKKLVAQKENLQRSIQGIATNLEKLRLIKENIHEEVRELNQQVKEYECAKIIKEEETSHEEKTNDFGSSMAVELSTFYNNNASSSDRPTPKLREVNAALDAIIIETDKRIIKYSDIYMRFEKL